MILASVKGLLSLSLSAKTFMKFTSTRIAVISFM
jgi:hypothetical protein